MSTLELDLVCETHRQKPETACALLAVSIPSVQSLTQCRNNRSPFNAIGKALNGCDFRSLSLSPSLSRTLTERGGGGGGP